MANVQIKGKVVLKDLGDPKGVLTMQGDKAKHVLGTIVGIATGVSRRANSKDPTKMDEALVGDFQAVPADPKLEGTRSGKCFLPEGMFNMIATKLEGENAAQQVQFAFEVATVKASNPIGYSWAFTPKVQASGADPLAELLAQATVPAIADKSAKK